MHDWDPLQCRMNMIATKIAFSDIYTLFDNIACRTFFWLRSACYHLALRK